MTGFSGQEASDVYPMGELVWKRSYNYPWGGDGIFLTGEAGQEASDVHPMMKLVQKRSYNYPLGVRRHLLDRRSRSRSIGCPSDDEIGAEAVL